MQSVKIVFKSIPLTNTEQENITNFLSQHNNLDFHFNAIYNEKEHKNSVPADINIWIVNQYDEKQSDKYHCVIRFFNLKDLLEEFEILIKEIFEIFAIEEEPAVSIKKSLLSNTDTKRYNIGLGKGELDLKYKSGVVEEDSEIRKKILKNNTTSIIGINPYKDLFK